MSFKKNFKKFKPLIIAVMIPLIIVLVIGIFFVTGFFVQWLWAETISDIFAVKEISYWQAIGLILLGKILLGNSFQVTKTSSKKKDKGNFDFHLGRKNVKIKLGDDEDMDKDIVAES